MAPPKKKQHSTHAQFILGNNTTVYPESLLSQLERHGHMRVEQILRAAHLPDHMKRDVERVLERLAAEGKVQRSRGGKWMHAGDLPTITGILSIQRSGAAFVRPDDPDELDELNGEIFAEGNAEGNDERNSEPSFVTPAQSSLSAGADETAALDDLDELDRKALEKLAARERGNSAPSALDGEPMGREAFDSEIFDEPADLDPQDALGNQVDYGTAYAYEDRDYYGDSILGKRNISLAAPEKAKAPKKAKPTAKASARSRKASNANDIFIHSSWLGDAWNNDRVEVVLLPGNSGPRVEGRVLRVIERKQTTISATLGPVYSNKPPLGRPTDSRLNFDLEIDISELSKRPKQGDLVLVETGERILLNPARWAAKALRVLGRESDAKVQEQLTKVNFAIPQEFSEDVLEEAEHVAAHTPLDLEKRTDLRELGLVTIDGADARDFDDAIYVEELQAAHPKKARWRLVVAIADVAHFVRPNSALDHEARERGNSCYFPCSVEPMLPQSLSNGVCSLKPDEDRAVLFAELFFNAEGEEVDSRFGAGLMRSQARLTYEQVQKALDKAANAELAEPAPAWLDMLRQAAPLADLLLERRQQRGSLDFELPEAAFTTNAKGEVTGMQNLKHLFSHSLIEAFMVAANESVARYLTAKSAPFLYRVHPEPGLDKVENLLRSLKAADLLPQGMRWPGKKDSMSNFLPELLNSVRGTNQEFVVHRLILRTMMQARYSPDLDVHFGLASTCYCHFTSPIRRYADLVTHRALRRSLGLDKTKLLEGQKLQDVADQCNARERVAQEAEREITRRFGCLLLEDKVGSEFKGVINGVTSFGLFVELSAMPVEGMVRLDKLGDDYFEYDPDRQELLGRLTGRRFMLGQNQRVRLVEVSVSRLEINLELTNKATPKNGKGRKNTGSFRTAKIVPTDPKKSAPRNPAKDDAGPRKPRPKKPAV